VEELYLHRPESHSAERDFFTKQRPFYVTTSSQYRKVNEYSRLSHDQNRQNNSLTVHVLITLAIVWNLAGHSGGDNYSSADGLKGNFETTWDQIVGVSHGRVQIGYVSFERVDSSGDVHCDVGHATNIRELRIGMNFFLTFSFILRLRG
jgi:hypothetical protein